MESQIPDRSLNRKSFIPFKIPNKHHWAPHTPPPTPTPPPSTRPSESEHLRVSHDDNWSRGQHTRVERTEEKRRRLNDRDEELLVVGISSARRRDERDDIDKEEDEIEDRAIMEENKKAVIEMDVEPRPRLGKSSLEVAIENIKRDIDKEEELMRRDKQIGVERARVATTAAAVVEAAGNDHERLRKRVLESIALKKASGEFEERTTKDWEELKRRVRRRRSSTQHGNAIRLQIRSDLTGVTIEIIRRI
ncbi:hypothetical protein K440DRAFT_618559 [Wilcoxina mikolae CBS 423.85]|nr:hypothetical protein K440DRAFT_618559 [Wilcoxina mikolae CBS 423.85]